MKATGLLTIFLCFYSMVLCQNSSSLKTDCDHRIQALDDSLKNMNNTYENKVYEMKQGLFCSKCMRSKSELERTGKDFYYHVYQEAHGQVVPATQEQLNQVYNEYISNFNSTKKEFNDLQNDCNSRYNAARNEEYRQQQDKQKEQNQVRFDANQRLIEEQNRLAAKRKQDAINQYNTFTTQLQQQNVAELNHSISELKRLTDESTRQTEIVVANLNSTINKLSTEELKSRTEMTEAAQGAFDGLLEDDMEIRPGKQPDQEIVNSYHPVEPASNPDLSQDAVRDKMPGLSENSIFSVTTETIADVFKEEALLEVLTRGGLESETIEKIEIANSMADLVEDPNRTLSDKIRDKSKDLFIDLSNNAHELIKNYIKNNEQIINKDGQAITSTLDPLTNSINAISNDEPPGVIESAHDNLSASFDGAVHAMSPPASSPSEIRNFIKGRWDELSSSKKGVLATGAVGGVMYVAGAPLTVPASIIIFTVATIAFK